MADMAKRLLEGPALTKGSALRGNLVIDAWRGTIRVKGWPRKRGKPKSAVTREQNAYFKSCLDLIAKMEPGFLLWCTERTKGTNIYPRDLAMQLLTGRGVSFVKPDGYVMFPEVFMQNVSTSLDSIAQDKGALLVRDDQYWTGLLPNTAGLVLTSQGEGELPAWAAVEGGGPWDFSPPLAADFVLGSGEATNLALLDDPDVGLMVDNLTSTVTNCVRYAVKPLPASDWSVIARLKNGAFGSPMTFGILAYEASSHAYYMAGARANGAGFTMIRGLTTGYVDSNSSCGIASDDTWVRLQRIGTKLRCYYSPDGKSWQFVFQEINLNSLFTVAPDHVGIGVQENQAGWKVGYSCPFWAQDWI